MQRPDRLVQPPARKVTYPSKSLFKPADGFVWVSAAATNIRETFARYVAESKGETA